ncbi:MAG: tRNA (adenosine(37)-N6)-dimethylallyltransferase MiaA [Candidatus Omnitrophica bacterium]|nr:tRNA (adenosine(37)-N6)-dimethylallyltransferase MiaA [Candidatus Omnitrophota bacterium]MBI2173792.1 tRNA (adenosine(37)-N6)-dimethylallyltransferase MiaA [Candidatus Omnitrophota bacterium]
MPNLIALIGPTAVGKTAVAIELAEKLKAEIVSCDSMQVYRRMPILTQAPSHAQRAQVPHHLVECIEPTDSFSVGRYRHLAGPLIDRLLERGKTVLVTGGTGLYLKALTEGLCEAPPADIKIRERLWKECQELGKEVLYERLKQIDSITAAKLHPNNARRIIRALEVYELTGKPLSSWWEQTSTKPIYGDATIVALNRNREELYRRINERLLHMIYEEDVMNEARRLLGLELSKSARQVHGLSDLERYLSGQVTLKDTIAIWQQRVRHYARRQLIWFRQTPRIRWVDISEDEKPWQTASRVFELVGQR